MLQDPHPIPPANDSLAQLASATMISKADTKQQVLADPTGPGTLFLDYMYIHYTIRVLLYSKAPLCNIKFSGTMSALSQTLAGLQVDNVLILHGYSSTAQHSTTHS